MQIKRVRRQKNITILGDSIIKHVNGYDVFSGAKVRCLKDHMKPSIHKKLGKTMCRTKYIFHQSRKEYFTTALEQKQVTSEQKR